MTTWTPEAVRDLRHRLGLTQTQFAARLGCSIQAVQHWEHGLRTPTGLYAAVLDRLVAQGGTQDGDD
jgi:putative transcriptional regulator